MDTNTEAPLNGCTKHFKRNKLVNVRRFLVGNCPAGSRSTENRTCILCPLGTYQPSPGKKDCFSCGQGLTTTSTGTTSQSQCTGISQTNYKIYFIFEALIKKRVIQYYRSDSDGKVHGLFIYLSIIDLWLEERVMTRAVCLSCLFSVPVST